MVCRFVGMLFATAGNQRDEAMNRTINDSSAGCASRPLMALALVAFLTSAAGAQIYEWVDESGVRHFTNSVTSVPDTARTQPRIVVEASPTSNADDASGESRVQPKAGQGAGEARQRPATVAFEAGWSRGFAAARAGDAPPSLVQPPVVIAGSPQPVVVEIPRYDPSGLFYRSPYTGAMTVPFDRGRSRGLTHRQQVEQLLQAQRDWQ